MRLCVRCNQPSRSPRAHYCALCRPLVTKGAYGRYNQSVKGKAREYQRIRKSRYGGAIYAALTIEEWTAIHRAQGGICAICHVTLRDRYVKGSAGKTAAVDHCHRVERRLLDEGVEEIVALRKSIRGLLCGYCNHKFLTTGRDRPEMFDRAAHYLRVWPASSILSMET